MRALLILLIAPSFVFAQGADFMDGVRPFMSFIQDAAVAGRAYGEAQFAYADFEGGSSIGLGAQGTYRLMPLLEGGARFAFSSVDPDAGEGESGLVDADVWVRYTLSETPQLRVVAGGMLNLPIGSEDLGEGTFDLEGFGALRYAMTKGVILGHFGLRINADKEKEIETPYGSGEVDRELQVLFGGGILYPVNEAVTLTGEFTFVSSEIEDGDSGLQLTPGVDYEMASGLKIRGALALGLSDGAPNLVLMAGVAKNF